MGVLFESDSPTAFAGHNAAIQSTVLASPSSGISLGRSGNSAAERWRTVMQVSQKAKERMKKEAAQKRLDRMEANKKEKENVIEMDGIIIQHSRSLFKVQLDNGAECQCTIAGRLRMNKIRVMEGDTVTVELSPFDLTRGRITFRKIDQSQFPPPPKKK